MRIYVYIHGLKVNFAKFSKDKKNVNQIQFAVRIRFIFVQESFRIYITDCR